MSVGTSFALKLLRSRAWIAQTRLLHQPLSQRNGFLCWFIQLGEATFYDRVNLANMWLSFP